VHLLPHWTWPERAGEVTPVHVFTSGDEAELFLNDQSLGRKRRGEYEYRLRWDDVVYQPGVLKVVAYKNGKHWAEAESRTVGAAAGLSLVADRDSICGDGLDLAFVTVTVVDKSGLIAPRADQRIRFSVEGPGDIVATDNGDPTSFETFSSQERKAFNGKCLVILRGQNGRTGCLKLTAEAEGLTHASVSIAIAPK